MTGAGRFAKGRLAAVLLAALMLGACAGFGGSLSCEANPSGSSELARFHQALENLSTGKRPRAVTILHLGDSHIASDRLAGDLAGFFQARFGDGGRGLFPPGIPFEYYARRGFSITASPGWERENSLRPEADGPFGLAGLSAQSASRTEWMRLDAAEGKGFSSVIVDVWASPESGALRIALDGRTGARIETEGEGFQRIELSGGNARRVELSPAGDGPVRLLGWGAAPGKSGVTYESHGIPGATLGVMEKWEESAVAAELRLLQPDLVILGYGTNEGFDDALDVAAYERRLDARLAWFKALLPEASFTVIGAIDGARGAGCAPPKLAALRAAQKRAAEKAGAFFFDGAAAMGGDCSIREWAEAERPLAFGDHVHLTDEGARVLAEKIYAALTAAYDAQLCRAQKSLF